MRTGEVLTHLEMLSPRDLVPARSVKADGIRLVEQDRFSPEIRSVTLRIGEPYNWPSQGWNDGQWRRYLDRPNLRHWVAEVDGAAAGLVSLDVDPSGNTEFDTFGLAPEHVGGGLGGHVLTMAVRLAWTLHPTNRLWLHTSSHDHPAALPNYQRRGFRVFER